MRALPLFVALIVVALLPAAALAAAPGSTTLVSRPDGLAALPAAFDNNSAVPGALSDDGRYAVFTSDADGFAPGADPTAENVFVRDTKGGTTTLVSRSDGRDGAGANADSHDPDVAVSSSGDVLVAFTTSATNLSDHSTGAVTPPAKTDEVWMRNVTRGTTTLVSRAGANGAPADRDSRAPSIGATDGGPVVAFESFAHNLGATVRNSGIYLRTVDAGVTALLSCKNKDCSGTPSADDSGAPDLRVLEAAPQTPCPPVLHPSGSCVLVGFDTIDSTISGDALRHVVLAAATAPAAAGTATSAPKSYFTVSQRADGKFGNRPSSDASLSADGRAVGFSSAASNFTADTIPADTTELYVWRFKGGSYELVSKAGSAPANDSVRSSALGGDSDHLRVAFSSLATNLGGPPDNAGND